MRHRRSHQRELILEIVRSTMDHPTAEWVHRQARRHLPRISVATVYRNLKELAAEGHVSEMHAGGQSTRFDANTGQHYHVRCVMCGRMADLPISVDRRVEEEAGRAINYRILGHRVEVLGVCPACEPPSRPPVPVNRNNSQ
jgi:Fur family transcriptional regulator, ferric uptake regulator